jgi:hypothetical protein
LLGLADDLGVIDQPLDDAGLVADLVKLPEIAADIGIGNLADQAEHRNVGGECGEQRRAGIEQARSRHHREGLRLAGRQRRAERHIARALLVAGVDGVQTVGKLEQRLEQKIVLHAGERIDGVEAVADQGGNDGFSGSHRSRWHGGRFAGRLFAFLRHVIGHSRSSMAASCADHGRSVEAAICCPAP